MGFALGAAAAMGAIAGIVVGMFAEYYTSYSYKPTRLIAESTQEGAAVVITEGMSVGMKSTMYPCVTLGIRDPLGV